MNSELESVDLFGQLTLESFRLNGQLLARGDLLSKDVGLTSARWQVLGTLVLAEEPLTVAEIARRMGLARQSVQRIADGLAATALIRYSDNPRHRRWKLAKPTAAGLKVYKTLETRRKKWAEDIVADISRKDLNTALRVIQLIKDRIVDQIPAGD